jgi:hypothetical protein
VCLVGDEHYGLETVMGVEDDRGGKRFWGRDKNFFGGKAHEGGSSRSIEICRFLKLVACSRDEGGELSRI